MRKSCVVTSIWLYFGFAGYLTTAPALAQNLLINEFLAANQSGLVDEDNEASDWIELFNPSAAPVELNGYTITDDAQNITQWTFPSVSIPARGFLVLWASGKDRRTPPNLHTNFKLKQDGEFVGLYAPDGNRVDRIAFGPQLTDVSLGRLPDGSSNFASLNTPTPGAPNQENVQRVTVSFSQPEGYHAGELTLDLATNASNGKIYYTLNGHEPTRHHTLYTGAIAIRSNRVVRARVYDGDTPLSEIETRTYLLDEKPNLPVLSLVTAPDNLWDSNIGIYVNYEREGRDWERPVHATLIENNATAFSIPAGIRIHGASSRHTDKKNFRLYFRSDYGVSSLIYPLFEQKPWLQRFERLVIYAPSGDQPTGSQKFTLIDDALEHSLWHEDGGNISSFRPASLYLNGEFWGVYWIREYVNEHYVETNFGLTDIDMLRSVAGTPEPEIRHGDATFWEETFSYFQRTDLRVTENYERVKNTYLELDNFTDYQIINIFGANWDWPHNNADAFHDRIGEDGRWRWIMWDTGAAWNHAEPSQPTLEWATRDQVRTDIKQNDREEHLWSTLMLRKLLQNSEYRNKFINRFADLQNTLLSSANVERHLNGLADMIRAEMPREMERWDVQDFSLWERNLENVRRFVRERPAYQREQIINQFDLRGSARVTIEPSAGSGSVTLNTITPAELPWTGTYYRGVPITLRAEAEPGYRFEKWSHSGLPADTSVTVDLSGDLQVHAIFTREIKPLEIVSVVIDSIDQESAQVWWTTNRPTIGYVAYGPDSSLGSKSDSTMSFATSHHATLVGLFSQTIYFLRVNVWDSSQLEQTSQYYSFVTAAPPPQPPVISAVRADSIEVHSAVIIWNTDQPAKSAVEFGLDTAYGIIMRDDAMRLQHRFRLAGLSDSTTYHFRVRNTNAAGVEAVSADQTFSTRHDRQPPAITAVAVLDTSTTSAIITWQTDELATGQVEFGLDEALGQFSEMESGPASHHSIMLENLLPDTLYHFRVHARDTVGNLAIGDMHTFRTHAVITGIRDSGSNETPRVFTMSEGFPNPVRHFTQWRLQLPVNGSLKAVVYNFAGQEVTRLFEGPVVAGYKTLQWNGKIASGRAAPSGTYLLQIQWEDGRGEAVRDIRRIVLQK